MTSCEVLVAGAGPSGLMTAALLARQGVTVRVVDAGAGPATESRAFAVQARTVELFRSVGLADELLARGVINTGITFHIRGRPVGGLDFDRARAGDTPYQFILMAPQNEVEQVLLDDLAGHGVTVERGTRLESFTQDDTSVRARLSTGDVTCRYLVGADGAHSTVRKQLGLSFEGDGYAQRFLLADCRVDWPFDHTRFRIFMNGGRIGLFLPLDGAARSRVMTTDPSGGSGPVTLDELQTELRLAMRVPVTLSDPVWTTRYQAHLRHVDRYRAGRAFLAGDAAHIHSPAGGQGMNTGLQDAANLAWKLAAVLHAGAGDALLDSYHDERHPVGVELLRFTDRLYRVAANLPGWRGRLRDLLGPFLIGRMSAAPLPHRKAFRRLSQTGLAYPPGPFAADGVIRSAAGPHAGGRAPDARLSTGRSMFDLLAGYRLRVVALSRKPLGDEEAAGLTAGLRGIEALGGGIVAHLVGRVACRRDPRVEPVDCVEVFERYGLVRDDAQALFVIRPDGYVAWRSDEIDAGACRSFLTRLLPAPAPEPSPPPPRAGHAGTGRW
ncbi:FAD-dependent monooxygenase [Pseudosporangium ferrugineum]|uniref:2-polyprenyl-6-methoxyphenol hydroxylase-like FAD-dependent oxidoreductase n=1 Tax=Pseudosporangium ferrugineum TaxID=439699 RepID=A0A2T0SEH9_9ACTN|nr:FAD-dependent monooxygenase [Pseudosporangium ferrugineum]PRY31826.1 2-polyprenyl-6-methoxyphenol hydroxylase-like FAD-dependent oxidoreductase [Pseudosporangium ferrugineum]